MLGWLVIASVVAGLTFASIAVVGVLRLPDVYTRAHASSKSDTLGIGLLLLAATVASGSTGTAIKMAALLAFVTVTNPLAAHALTRSARRHERATLETDGGGR